MADFKPGDHVRIDAEWNDGDGTHVAIVILDGWDGNRVRLLEDNDVFAVPREHLTVVARSVPMTPKRIEALAALDEHFMPSMLPDAMNYDGRAVISQEHIAILRAMLAEARGAA